MGRTGWTGVTDWSSHPGEAVVPGVKGTVFTSRGEKACGASRPTRLGLRMSWHAGSWSPLGPPGVAHPRVLPATLGLGGEGHPTQGGLALCPRLALCPTCVAVRAGPGFCGVFVARLCAVP